MQPVPSEFLNGYAATPEFADSQCVTFPGCERGISFRSNKLNGGGQMRLLNRDTLHLDCGRDVVLDECYMKRSALGWVEGDKDYIRTEVIEGLPEKIRRQFPGEYYGVLIEPISDGLPSIPSWCPCTAVKRWESIPTRIIGTLSFVGWETISTRIGGKLG
jgi:hypothetical protein